MNLSPHFFNYARFVKNIGIIKKMGAKNPFFNYAKIDVTAEAVEA
jgi:hypothetical protein